MGFIVEQISNYGTEHPIVARLSIQTDELLRSFFIPQQQRDLINEICMLKVQPSLLHCWDIMVEIESEFEKRKLIPESELVKNQVIVCPSIIGLELLAKNFLEESKSILMYTFQLLNVFYSPSIKDSRYDLAHKWAIEKFVEDDELTIFIKNHHDNWLKVLQEIRDAVVHPYTTKYKKLLIENIAVQHNSGHIELIQPIWHREGEPASSIIYDMKVYINNLLIFCEELLVLLLKKTPPVIYVQIREIPESNREAKSPIRFHPVCEHFPSEYEMKIMSDFAKHGIRNDK